MTRGRKAIWVVPCGKAKVWDKEPERGRIAARDVYVGSFAVAARKYAEHFNDGRWLILSAKYGFLAPDDVVPGPYEVSFTKGSTGVITTTELTRQAAKRGLDKNPEVVVIAGRAYVDAVRAALAATKVRVVSPLAGLGGMGMMMAALKRARERDRPLPLRRPRARRCRHAFSLPRPPG